MRHTRKELKAVLLRCQESCFGLTFRIKLEIGFNSLLLSGTQLRSFYLELEQQRSKTLPRTGFLELAALKLLSHR